MKIDSVVLGLHSTQIDSVKHFYCHLIGAQLVEETSKILRFSFPDSGESADLEFVVDDSLSSVQQEGTEDSYWKVIEYTLHRLRSS